MYASVNLKIILFDLKQLKRLCFGFAFGYEEVLPIRPNENVDLALVVEGSKVKDFHVAPL